MSTALDVSACQGDRGGNATNKHFPSCLCRSVDGLQANTGANSNRGPMIFTGDEECFRKCDVLEVGGPEK
jgi:hypothetical protein